MMTVTYPVKNGIYINMTNRCPCACTFCLRNNASGVYHEGAYRVRGLRKPGRLGSE